MYHAKGWKNAYIAIITARHFTPGVITINVCPYGATRDRPVDLHVLYSNSPRLVIFPVASVMGIFGIQTKTCVEGLWFACGAMPPGHSIRRGEGKMTADWRGHIGPLRLGMNRGDSQLQERRHIDDRVFWLSLHCAWRRAAARRGIARRRRGKRTARGVQRRRAPIRKVERWKLNGKKTRRGERWGELGLENFRNLRIDMSNEE